MIYLEGFLKSGAYGVALYRIEGETEGKYNKDGEKYSHPRLFQTFLHIVSWAPDEGIFPVYLI